MAERYYAEWLERERLAGRVWMWEHHPEPLVVRGRGVRPLVTLNVDFLVMPNAVMKEWHEVKGLATPAWRIKRHVLSVQCPRLRYVVVDAGRGVCATGEGGPALFDERPRKKRRKR